MSHSDPSFSLSQSHHHNVPTKASHLHGEPQTTHTGFMHGTSATSETAFPGDTEVHSLFHDLKEKHSAKKWMKEQYKEYETNKEGRDAKKEARKASDSSWESLEPKVGH